MNNLSKKNILSELTTLDLCVRFVVCIVIYIVLYMLNNRFQYYKPTLIPLTWVDSVFSFNPYGVYPYLFAYIFPAVVYLRMALAGMYDQIRKFQCHFLLTTFVANLLFFFFPTTIQNHYNMQPLEALMAISDSLTGFLLFSIYRIDQPFNCLPSLHVASAFVSCIALINDKRWIYIFSLFSAVLITISTFWVKQHYALDAFTGFMLALLTYLPSQYLLQKYK